MAEDWVEKSGVYRIGRRVDLVRLIEDDLRDSVLGKLLTPRLSRQVERRVEKLVRCFAVKMHVVDPCWSAFATLDRHRNLVVMFRTKDGKVRTVRELEHELATSIGSAAR